MPLALALIGVVLVLVGVRNTYGDFAQTLKGEFAGQGSFLYRAVAILMIGVIGYAGERWRQLSVALMTLMVLGLLVTRDRGFFDQLRLGVQAAPVTPTAAPSAPPPVSTAQASAPSPGATPTSLDGDDLLRIGARLIFGV